ncbi:MAG: hypothetical protein FJ197_02995 [Gammaproteobacteria bacterium]|nr:hypothetical protein [Gammaproteobacteria bacterium]
MASAKTKSKPRKATTRKPAATVRAKPAKKAAKPVTAAKAVARPVPKPAPVRVTTVLEKFPTPPPPGKISAQPEPFRLVAIERAEPPLGAAGKNWYRYTIRQGVNAINGYLQGTQTGVKHSAEQIVGQLNERRAGRWGYRTTRTAAPAQAG